MSDAQVPARVKGRSSTQDWLDVAQVGDGQVRLKSGQVAALMEVRGIGFGQLSYEEQDAVIDQYRAFLNALNCPVQIVSTTEVVRLDGYLNALKERASVAENDELRLLILAQHDFLRDLVHLERPLTHRHFVVVWAEATAGGLIERRRGHVQAGLEAMGLACTAPGRAPLLNVLVAAYGAGRGLPGGEGAV